jgi:hypothetical protein
MTQREFHADDLQDVYKAIGGAVWHVQFLEDVLVNCITMRLRVKRPGTVDSKTANAMLEGEREKTLGQLLKAASAGGLVHGETEEAFRLVLGERNWLVHCSMHESSLAVETLEGRAAFLERVEFLKDRSIALKKSLAVNLFDWLRGQGVDVDTINAATEARFRSHRGG